MGRDDPLGLIGSTLDERVAIEEVVGEGGFGVVYRGRHLGFEEAVAVKCLKVPAGLDEAQRSDIIRRFRGEARMLHKLSRKTTGIVQALDVGAWTSPSGTWAPYIVMEWLHGSTLEQDLHHRAQQGTSPRSVASAVELLRPAAEALGIAHGHKVAHLDVKPANLFLALDDDEVTLKVLDFGVAKVFNSSKSLTRSMAATQGAARAFTPQYAAPEQFEPRHGRLGPHTDVFALGLILLELATGAPALSGETPLQLYMSAINELARPTFATRGVEVSAAAEEVLRCALAVDANERFGDALTMWEALLEAVGSEGRRSSTTTSAVVPREVVEAATMAGTGSMATTGHNRLCTILVGELRGLTALEGKLDPEQVAQLTDRALEAPRKAVEQLGGTVYELAAGRMVAIFGLGTDDLNAAERAVTAALMARDAVAELRQAHRPLRDAGFGLRVGLQTGRVYVNTHRQSRVTGSPLTLATELQQGADLDQVVIGRDTQRQVAGQFETEPVAHDPNETSAPAYRVLGRTRRRHDLRHLAHSDFLGVATRFIGREGELAELDAAIDQVLEDGIPRDLLLVAERGLGKSRLLLELAGRLRHQDFFVLAAASQSAGGSVSYGLVAALLRAQFHLHEDEPPDVAETKLRAGLRALGRSAGRAQRAAGRRRQRLAIDDLVGPLMRVLGMSRGAEAGSTALSDSDLTRARIAAAFASVVQLPGRPVAILCDDAQWADPASLALLDELRLRVDAPLLIACAAMPAIDERHPTWARMPERQPLELEPLSRRQLDRMARDRLQRATAIPDELVDKLTERAEGNALALVEMIHLLVDAGVVQTGGDPWIIDASQVDDIALPTTVQAIVQARLDRLGSFGSTLLCHAAVIGRSFWPGAVAALLERDSGDLAPTLERILDRQLVVAEPSSSFPDERELRFAEASTREVAYEMLSASARRDLHRKAAEWLEDRLLSEATSALVAEHYERAAAPLDAIDCYLRAARHASSLGQHEDALPLYQRARDLDARLGGEQGGDLLLTWDATQTTAPPPWADRVRVRFELADALRLDGQLDDAERTYAEARGYVDPEGDATEGAAWEARLAYRLAMLGELRGDVEPSLARLERAIVQAKRAQLPAEEAQMLALVAALELRRNDDSASRAACLAGLRVLRRLPRRGPSWREAAERLLRTLGGTLYRRKRLVGAERCYRQALRLIGDRDFPHLAARLHNNIAGCAFARGDVEAAGEAFTRALEVAERAGEMVVIMATLANLGEVEQTLGHHEEAIDYLEEAVTLGERIGASGDLADAYRNLAAALVSTGDDGGAREAAKRALSLASAEAGALYLPSVITTLTRDCLGALDEELRESVKRVAEQARQAHPETMAEALERLDG